MDVGTRKPTCVTLHIRCAPVVVSDVMKASPPDVVCLEGHPALKSRRTWNNVVCLYLISTWLKRSGNNGRLVLKRRVSKCQREQFYIFYSRKIAITMYVHTFRTFFTRKVIKNKNRRGFKRKGMISGIIERRKYSVHKHWLPLQVRPGRYEESCSVFIIS